MSSNSFSATRVSTPGIQNHAWLDQAEFALNPEYMQYATARLLGQTAAKSFDEFKKGGQPSAPAPVRAPTPAPKAALKPAPLPVFRPSVAAAVPSFDQAHNLPAAPPPAAPGQEIAPPQALARTVVRRKAVPNRANAPVADILQQASQKLVEQAAVIQERGDAPAAEGGPSSPASETSGDSSSFNEGQSTGAAASDSKSNVTTPDEVSETANVQAGAEESLADAHCRFGEAPAGMRAPRLVEAQPLPVPPPIFVPTLNGTMVDFQPQNVVKQLNNRILQGQMRAVNQAAMQDDGDGGENMGLVASFDFILFARGRETPPVFPSKMRRVGMTEADYNSDLQLFRSAYMNARIGKGTRNALYAASFVTAFVTAYYATKYWYDKPVAAAKKAVNSRNTQLASEKKPWEWRLQYWGPNKYQANLYHTPRD